MIFQILTLFPEAFKGYLESSILGRAIQGGKVKINLINFREFTTDKHKTCDDMPYGGGPGMLIKPEPLSNAIESLDHTGKRVIYLSPSGLPYDQEYAERLSSEEEIIIICGHYEGIDQRIIDLYVTDELSIGDYILLSGEVGAMVLIDSIVRLLGGIINRESISEESFKRGLLEYPQYTRPRVFKDLKVPDVLVSGNHARINEWRKQKGLEKTYNNRPDLLKKAQLSEEEKNMLKIIIGKGDTDEFNQGS